MRTFSIWLCTLLLSASAAAQLLEPIAPLTSDLLDTPLPELDLAKLRNAQLERELERLNEERETAGALNEQIEADIEQVSISLKNTDERLAIVGLSGSVAQLLITERKRLKSFKEQLGTLSEVQRQLASAKLKRIDYREERLKVANPRRAAQELLAAETDRSRLSAAFAARKALLPALELAQDALVKSLSNAELKLTQLIALSARLKSLLDERLLWTPSEEALDGTFVRAFPGAIMDFLSPERWRQTASLSVASVLAAPLLVLLGLLLLAALHRLRGHAVRKLDALAEQVRRARAVDFRPTLNALGWTLLGALQWPVFLLGVSVLLRAAGDEGRFSDSLGRALSTVAGVYFCLSVFGWTLRERGLAHAHFRWTQKRRQALRATLRPLALLVLPMVFFVRLSFARDLGGAADAVSRMVLIVGMFGLAWVCFRALKSDGIGAQRGVAQERNALLRKAVQLTLTLGAVALALLSAAGYHLSALALAERALTSAQAVLLLTLLHGLISRWLVLNERRLIFQRRDERREQAAHPLTHSAEAVTEVEAAEITIERIGDQTRRLLRAATVTVAVLMLWGIWAELLPALKVLDSVTMWRSSDLVDGVSVSTAVTLKSMLLALLAFSLMWIALGSLGGVLELGLNRFELDAATRYAILSIARYVVVVVGLGLALSWLGLRWGHFQWLAAAFTVGLGFGLQEIFANFVSGLIVLFERPFRVGDTITVGTSSGTVTRIRTRATTLLDWDNKEIVIPNKTFITGQLTNWTLSDSVTRVTISLSVAHTCDPKMIHRELREIARAHPSVLADPAPSTWLSAISDAGMLFDLRFFVGALGHRATTTNDLLEAISERLRDGIIVLPLPLPPPPPGLASAPPATKP